MPENFVFTKKKEKNVCEIVQEKNTTHRLQKRSNDEKKSNKRFAISTQDDDHLTHSQHFRHA